MSGRTRSEHTEARAGGHEDAQGRQYLTFNVGGETFAIPIASIREIIEYRRPTDVPMMPPFMRGVINLRGHVVPVIDLSLRFARAPIEIGRRTCIVVLEAAHEGQSLEIGALVDGVTAVQDIGDSEIEPPPAFGANLREDFISGMGKVGERFAIILDMDKVFSVEELTSLVPLATAAHEG